MLRLKILLAAIVVAATALPARAVELVMVEQAGCIYCAHWNEQIAPAYPKTAEGRFAPLRRVDLHAMPSELKTARRVLFTPTFLLVEDNRELARMEGYAGDQFFWPLLDEMLRQHSDYKGEGS
ncbi:hypothetical protein [Seohaeicola zhoushanensis]|uniref:Thioredoxin family protein n=1 Tax=Seohaeicola zhoushanensis TaxID=1569283 RepID=A0A8J3GXI7_9RHOB|nr:hypothetical protein [Seohaeicola zhoushanensis]GHF49086.1 hypothetical protein GCM10017056_20830 [Seohaeicola zhoushanensis]